ncbi:phosphoenolpyruvate hydrolase family protein [Candidatus Poribacteria bacterium]|jgi:predicted TIM-barrel enzyme|nr:phosphoenolpyruvate hydrolase family protein [Candidatus Poribacteria bacterium]MBT5533724.1 phosphoenolpyruvate hydrolase family protein [Candidatus Poribacteria bacterium]MBT5714682.1 phosphoenolpyruvate hydrolase family protein [Candidatus Poribacteria bacterium]MBT7099765.1 phosphoenolpyruvate hydrolase family protein [Candidatus Poribacteria bacterium]MBT7804093.1 phosphoenolpyruvate hydrolase family protein [Candidatus Poribacteria bacterium]
MPNPHTRDEVLARLRRTLDEGRPIIAAGAGTGISAKFIERGGADLIIIYNSGRFRMSGFGSCAGLLAYGDANQIVMEMGEREVLPVVQDIPVIAGVNGTDPTRRMWHFLKQVEEMGFSGVNNFPTVGVIDGHFRVTLEETGMGFYKEVDMIRTAREMGLFTIVYVFNAEESRAMAEAGADVIIAHCSTTVGGSIGVGTAMSLDDAAELVQIVIDAGRAVNPDVLFLSHGGPVATPADAAYINEHTDAVGFVGASSLERFATEASVEALTREFKAIPLDRRV